MRRVLAAILGVWLAACRPPPPSAARYPIAGQLLAVQLDTGQVLIAHEEIPGYMGAMTMPFRVLDVASIRDRRPGDLVTATLVVDTARAYLEHMTSSGTAALPAATARPRPHAVSYLAPGDPAPDSELVDHRGRSLSLTAWRGQAVVITFIYTSCPLPDYCPLLDRLFAEVDSEVHADAELRGRVRLLSVSFDPDHDTARVLAAHATSLGASAAWLFATGPAATVDAFAAAFGVHVIREADRTITHNLRTAVIGPDGRVLRIHSGNDVAAAGLLADVRRALHAPTTP